MINNKLFVVAGALVLVCVALVSASSECEGCRGNQLIQYLDIMEDSRKCWFNAENSKVLPDIKLVVLAGVGGVLEGLRISTNLSSSLRCKNIVLPKPCLSIDKANISECMVSNMKSIAMAYRDVEACNGKALDATKLDLMFKVISGTVVGWREVHSDC